MDFSLECDAMPKLGETLSGSGFMMNEGGKGGNQAVACARMGADTSMIAKVGIDSVGSQLKGSLSKNNINCDFVYENGTQSGIAMIVRIKGDNFIILNPGSNHELTLEETGSVIENEVSKGDFLIAQLECVPEMVFESLKLAKSKGVTTILNPAPAKLIPDEYFEYIDYFIVNQTECEFYTGIYPNQESECKLAMDKLCKMGVKFPLITLGSNGSVAFDGEKIVSANAYKAEAVDTTGAGDTYIGAFCAKRILGESLEKAMDFASKASAVTVTRLGAQKSIPNLSEVENYLG